jgi:DNA helicase-4
VDFEDMLVKAADHLERNNVDLGYDLVLVDEFQDASHARVRLVAGLVNKPHRHVLAVGDDWQSINRFAGADISAMTDFREWFGDHEQLQLTRTFRFSQDLADASSRFVTSNPKQIAKTVTADRPTRDDDQASVEFVYAKPSEASVADQLAAISKELKRPGSKARDRASVFILGRYGFDKDHVPSIVPEQLDITFSTVHSSKGLEADYVIVPNMAVGTYGFPSEIADDPVLDLAMTEPDPYPTAEERRLFYVALTRAREKVILMTDETRPSPFVVELLATQDTDPGDPKLHICMKCRKGTMVERRSRYGAFYGCSRFPGCDAKAKTADGPLIKKRSRSKS